MGRVCSEIEQTIQDRIERPVEQFLGQWEQQCRTQPCNWWCLCCNKWFCWLAWVVVRIIVWVVEIVTRIVTRVVCEVVNVVLDVLGFIFTLLLSVPIIGGILRTIWNWVTEIFWRLVGLLDFFASLVGIRPRKKMYFGVVVPSVGGTAIAPDSEIMRQVNATIAFYDSTCNINAIFTGICHTQVPPPEGGLTVGCDAGGFFNDWWVGGSYFEFASSLCKFRDTFRRVIGLGAELIVFVVQEITPGTTNGCSFASTHNYVLIEARPGDQDFVIAHEIGHACWLPHDGDPANLMNPITPTTNPLITNVQISLVRWSRHVVYF
jgi:hypothetical protein